MIQWHTSLSSTMDLAHELAKEGAPHGDAVVAREQLRGRGRRGQQWHAAPGGLWISVICRPEAPTGNECLSVRVGLALAAVVESNAPGIHLMIKWPNDLLLQGRKVAGILCEARWSGSHLDWTVVGFGLNLTNEPPADLAKRAVRLSDVTDEPPSVDSLAPQVAAAIAEAGAISGALTPAEIMAFDGRDALRGQTITEPAAGTAAGISSSGALVVIDSEGRSRQVLGRPGGGVAVVLP